VYIILYFKFLFTIPQPRKEIPHVYPSLLYRAGALPPPAYFPLFPCTRSSMLFIRMVIIVATFASKHSFDLTSWRSLLRFPSFYSIPSTKCRYRTHNYATNISFYVLPSLWITVILSFEVLYSEVLRKPSNEP